MKRVTQFGAALAILMTAWPAAAQSAGATSPSAKLTWSVGGFGGLGMVKEKGLAAGGEVGVRVYDMIDIIAEGFWASNVVTNARATRAANLATYLQTTQGKTATGVVTMPAGFVGAGFRLFINSGWALQPYLIASFGVARVNIQPKFTLSGSDVTTQLATYGVTLGSDLSGSQTKNAFGGGVGVRAERGAWYMDGSFRITQIQTDGEHTNVIRAIGGFGFRF